MDAFAPLLAGFAVAITPFHLTMALCGAFVGTLIGALPGIGPTNGVAILIPLSFTLGLEPVAVLILLDSVYYGSMYGGRISSRSEDRRVGKGCVRTLRSRWSPSL